jgi:hypothetical protein
VEADSPKNLARIPLSMPMTSSPSDEKYRTASDPTSPEDPVMIATLTRAPFAIQGVKWIRTRPK